MYHIVDDDNTAVISVSRRTFKEHMQYLKAEGYSALTIAEYVAAIRAEVDNDFERKILITFDDGYIDVLSQACPILAQVGYTACVFLVSNYAGRLNWWNRKACYLKAHLSWQEVRELVSAGFDLGAHTKEHHCLLKLDVDTIEDELRQSRLCIEQETGHSVLALSYPYGDVNETIAGIASKYFDVAFSVNQGRGDARISPYMINRISVDREWSVARMAVELSRVS
jgi:peptidoglycan/xylan/chitin deacetylase (PgdA/CDA1 family)